MNLYFKMLVLCTLPSSSMFVLDASKEGYFWYFYICIDTYEHVHVDIHRYFICYMYSILWRWWLFFFAFCLFVLYSVFVCKFKLSQRQRFFCLIIFFFIFVYYYCTHFILFICIYKENLFYRVKIDFYSSFLFFLCFPFKHATQKGIETLVKRVRGRNEYKGTGNNHNV